jgi:competence protein ComEA
MLKRILAALMALFAAAAFAAVDVNKASQADLETIKGIGPAISAKILDARKSGAFKDWPDLITRVSGIGETNAAKFSEAGLTVGGTSYKDAAPAAPKDKPKPAAKAAPQADAKSAGDAKAGKAVSTAASRPAEAASKPAAKK